MMGQKAAGQSYRRNFGNFTLEKPLLLFLEGNGNVFFFGQSFLNNPHLLVLDEPAQNLDVSGATRFLQIGWRKFTKNAKSVYSWLHDLHMVMASATNEVICLFHHVCCCGKPHVVTQDLEFITLFGNDMASMMSAYQHSHDHIHQNTHSHDLSHS